MNNTTFTEKTHNASNNYSYKQSNTDENTLKPSTNMWTCLLIYLLNQLH